MVTKNRDISSVAKANKMSSSARTTIPKRVMERLKLDVGDLVEWELHGKVAHVKKLGKTVL
jgi:antitoxin component of MazEF toxin-antitoxin module